jgi:hypothetical protein
MTQMLRMKSKPAPAVTPVDYDIKILRLRAVDKDLLKQLIEVERLRTGEPEGAPPTTAAIEAEARRLAEGGEIDIPDDHPDKLFVLRSARAAVARAVGIFGELQFQHELELALSERQRRAAEWASIVRDTIVTVCDLQRLNRRRAALANEIRGGSSIVLPCEFPAAPQILLGRGNANDAATQEFLRTAIDEGIVTQGEIDRLSADNGKVHK